MKKQTEREKKDKDLFNRIVKAYIKKDLYIPSRIARKYRLIRTLECSGVKSCESLLELGCGGGFSAVYLDGFYKKYTGIDYSDSLITYAREKHNFKNIVYINENIKTFSPDEKYDVILMIGVLHHIDDVDEALKRIIKWLNPGGVLVTNEPHRSNLLITFARETRKIIDKNYSSDQIEFKIKELRTIYENAKLTNIEIIPQGFLSTIFAEVILKPEFLMRKVSRFSCWFDRLIENFPGRLIASLSWNVISIGRKEHTEI